MRTQNCFILILLVLVHFTFASANECSDCSKRAYFKFSDKSEEDRVMRSTWNRLSEVLPTDCFHMSHAGISEYRVEASFETDLSGDVDSEGKPVKSRLTINLFHDETGELLKTWKTESHNNNIRLHHQRMFRKPRSVLKNDRPVEPYLWEFEKRPVKADIKPEHQDVFANEMAMLKIKNIVDEEGQTSREFNRIIVCPDKGTINAKLLKNGAQWEMDEKCGVFRVGKGALYIPYVAPSVNRCNGDLEQIIVYSSCDSLSVEKLPLSKTRSRKEIGVKQFGLICLKPRKLTLNYKYYLLYTTPDGTTETNVRATAEIALAEPTTWRHTGSEYSHTKVPFKSIKIVDFFAKRVCNCKEGKKTYTGSAPRYDTAANRALDKKNATLFHDKDDYRKMKLFFMNPIYYHFTWNDGRTGGLGFYFLELSKESVLPGLKTRNHWLDQLVTEGDGYHQYGGKGYRKKEGSGNLSENRFEWSFTQ